MIKSIQKKFHSKFNPPDLKARLIELFLYPFLKSKEDQERLKWNKKRSSHSPVFIIGPPRSGSTLLYSLLAYSTNLLYISNFTHAFASALFTGFELYFKKNFPKVSNFNSKYGDTHKAGPAAPSECARFWYYYLSKEKHYTRPEDVSEEGKKFIYDYINGLSGKYQKPFLFKNLNAAVRIPLLLDLFPNARFIFIHRDPFFNSQSVLQAKRNMGIEQGDWWSVKPLHYKETAKLPEYESAVKQCVEIEKHIFEDTRELTKDQLLLLSYDDLCQNPGAAYKKLISFIGEEFFIKKDIAEEKISYNRKVKLSDEEHSKLISIINDTEWKRLREQFYERQRSI